MSNMGYQQGEWLKITLMSALNWLVRDWPVPARTITRATTSKPLCSCTMVWQQRVYELPYELTYELGL